MMIMMFGLKKIWTISSNVACRGDSVMSKRWAKIFVKTTPNTKLVRVEQNSTGVLNQCYQNALEHSKKTGSKMVAGWVVVDGKYSVDYKNNPDMLAFAVRHWWNKHRGHYIDTTPFVQGDNFAYIVQQDYTQDSGWITFDNEYDVKYMWDPFYKPVEETA